jgi:hypothetical protein
MFFLIYSSSKYSQIPPHTTFLLVEGIPNIVVGLSYPWFLAVDTRDNQLQIFLPRITKDHKYPNDRILQTRGSCSNQKTLLEKALASRMSVTTNAVRVQGTYSSSTLCTRSTITTEGVGELLGEPFVLPCVKLKQSP